MSRTIRNLRHTKLAARLIAKIRTLKDFPVDFEVVTDYALLGFSHGHHQKSAGAWSWELWRRCNGEWMSAHIAGAEPASRMVKKDVRLSWYNSHYDTEVVAEN